MADAYIRIDVQIPRDRLAQFLQGVRDLEQEAPDEIHLAIQVTDNDASMQESEELMRSISPDLPYFRRILKQ